MMDAVKRGGNRQDLHERIREHSMAAGKRIKEEGLENDMVDRIAGDPMFGMTREQILEHLDPVRLHRPLPVSGRRVPERVCSSCHCTLSDWRRCKG